MTAPDIMFVIRWWFMLFAIGIVFLPLTTLIFKNFFDKGYIFARILGMALVTYAVFVLGILKILPFSEPTIILTIICFLIINIFLIFKRPNILVLLKNSWKIFLFEELLFISGLFFWSYIRAHQPDIHGLEKYEDFGFLNSILRSEYFPPKDMWFTPFSINYYYFGHLITAMLTKLSTIPSFITFNLMLATIFALTFTGVFSITANLLFNLKSQISNLKIIFAGLLSGFIATMAGSLHTIYTFFKPYVNENPVPFWHLAFSPQTFPNSYWYPNATRFIHNTIHEYPLYSFVVSDLHAHVLDMPFVLFAIALLFSLLLRFTNHNDLQTQNLKLKTQNYGSTSSPSRAKSRNNSKFKIFNFGLPLLTFNFKLLTLLLGFILAILYMTNAWDGIIYFLLAAIVIAYIQLKLIVTPEHQQNKKYILHTTYYILLLVIGSILFSLPFSINFKPFASGIGVLCAPEFLTNIGKIGPFLFEKDHCLRSPIWQLIILYGFFYFFVIAFFASIFPKVRMPQNGKLTFIFRSLAKSDIFVLLLILLSTLLIIIPEFIYIKDIYPGHYRANTMFKLVYQSFIMLSIASGYTIIKTVLSIKGKLVASCYLLVAICFLYLVFSYPHFAINSYYNLKTYQGLDGIKYLKPLYPTDYEGILWINKNIKGQPVILEAQGDSYSDYGRISTNTGLPTVLGWTVHEWLWRGTYDVPSPRIPEVQTLYEAESIDDTKKLIEKYKVKFVFIGKLEREKYPKLNEEKFKKLGKNIYQNGETKIYKLSN